MKKILLIFGMACVPLLLTVAACSSRKSVSSEQRTEEPSVGVSLDGDQPIIMRRGLNGLGQPLTGSAPAVLPKGLLYKTSGDYNNNVPVQLSADGKTLISFPAPGDIPDDPLPVVLADGWLLSRIGVTDNTRFTRWTYAEYHELPQVPTPKEIIDGVIPGARVTMTMPLPMTIQEALADTAAVNDFIKANRLILTPER